MADNGIKAGEAVEVLVSVIMPAWNCAGTIGKAIDSVLVQDVPLELIVVNDTSPDDLDAVMKTYASDPRVRYVKNEHNLGASRQPEPRCSAGEGKLCGIFGCG